MIKVITNVNGMTSGILLWDQVHQIFLAHSVEDQQLGEYDHTELECP